jgi:uncharacterized protein (DUF58 family)
VKRSSPRNSSRVRLRVLAAIILGVLVVTGVLVGSLLSALILTILLTVLLVLSDLLMLRLSPQPRIEDLELTLALRSEAAGGAFTTGGAVTVEATVRNAGASRLRLEIIPLRPPGLLPLGSSCGWITLGRDESDTISLRYRIGRVGPLVVPGVLVRRWSLFRLFRRARLIVDRIGVTVLPNYGTSDHPIVARFLRADAPGSGERKGRAIRGQGTEFAELRGYQPLDPMRRVDWKATARRGRLLVREFEEPPEYTIRVVLDGSSDLTEAEGGGDAFAHAADLVGKLAYVAALRGMKMCLTVYDRTVIIERTIDGKGVAFQRLLADLVQVPRLARLREMGKRSPDEVTALAGKAHSARVAPWRGRETFGDFLRCYQKLDTGAPGDPASYLLDFAPGSGSMTDDPCPKCGEPLFPDEPGCPACGGVGPQGALPERAACLAGVLAKGLRQSRGREMLVVISAFCGGEVSPAIADILTLAATGFRKVHVMLPTHRAIMDDRAEMPGSMGTYPSKTRTLRDIDVLEAAERMREFIDRVHAAGVATHPIDDAAELEELVAQLLVAEVLDQ